MHATLAGALATVLRLPEPPALTVAGRTDAGVHARGQVAHVDVPQGAWAPVADSAVRRLAGVLPPDVRVKVLAPAPPGFDARFSAVSRRYAYRVCDDPAGVDPLRRAEVLWHPKLLDLVAMNEASAALIGEHDFAAYCRRRPGASTVRHLLALRWERSEDGLAVCTVAADAFCHHMVRGLVGALLAVGEGRRDVHWPAGILAAGVRDSAVGVVRPHGLCLEEVSYPADDLLARRAERTRRPRVGEPAGPGVTEDPVAVVEATYDALGERYLRWGSQVTGDPREEWLDDLLMRLPDGARVVDLGCGAGVPSTDRLAERCDVLGIDVSGRQVELARRLVPSARFEHADLLTWTTAPESLDAVTAFFVFGHVPRERLGELLRRCAGWLRPGGLLLATFGVGDVAGWRGEWLGVPTFFSSWDPATNRALLADARLVPLRDEVVSMDEPEGAVSFHWLLASRE